jgi:hypothetical protein
MPTAQIIAAAPPVLILRLVRWLQRAGCPFGCSLALIAEQAEAEIAARNAAAQAATQIDDPLERRHALLAQALANDPPRVRREILAAVAAVHAATEAQRLRLAITLPLPPAGE